jgi:pimeloyl-ACP methyl ester carboxylesterase
MAAEYAKNNVNNLDGLIMYASYPANYEEFVNFPIPILTIIGSKDPGAPQQQAFYEAIRGSARRFIIDGANHRQYADYSFQKDDGIATISAAEQQDQIIAVTTQFMDTLE